MRPVGGHVLVRAAKKPQMTSGEHGSPLYIPDKFREHAHEGVVLGVGPGWVDRKGFLHPIDDVKEGDRVLFVKRAGQDLVYRKEKCRLLRYEDVLAVVEVEN
jgi:co-chaperonin GroES (HSP10)